MSCSRNVLIVFSLAAGLLVACAGTPPESSGAATKSVGTAAAVGESAAGALERRSRIADYRLVNRGGKELYCKTDITTGTRVNAKETCYTEAQLERIRDDAQDYLRDVQRPPQEVIDSQGASGA